jgi:SpoVK/Ycf46/Vps4 family AAA+-type ATPase
MDDQGHNVPYSEIEMIREMSLQPGVATVKNKKSVAFKETEEGNIIKIIDAYMVPPHDREYIKQTRRDMEKAINDKSPKKYSEIIKQ